VRGLLRGCTGSVQDGAVEACVPRTPNLNDCHQDCDQGDLEVASVLTNETAEVVCWPCVLVGKLTANATVVSSGTGEMRDVSGVLLGGAVVVSLVVAMTG